MSTIEAALLALTSVDQDYASEQNGVGFSGTDTKFGHSLAKQVVDGRDLSYRQRLAAYTMLKKYHEQLKGFGIDYDAIPAPQEPDSVTSLPPKPRVLDFREGVFVFDFPFDRDLKDDLKKNVPGRRWIDALKVWAAPKDSTVQVAKFALRNGFSPTDSAMEVIKGVPVVRDTTKSVEMSNETESDFEIPGLSKEPYPFQRAGVAYALKHLEPNKGIYIGDEMGLGKTVQALSILHLKGAYPALVAVPRVVWLKWAREVQQWTPGHSVILLGGRVVTKRMRRIAERFGATIVKLGEPIPEADVYVVKYSLFFKWAKPVGRAIPNSKRKRQHATGALKGLKLASITFDEAHYLKEDDSQRTKAADGVVNTLKPPVRLALSGTPIPNRHQELLPVLRMLNRVKDVARSEWDYLNYFCNPNGYEVKGFFGWDWTGSPHGDELNRRMRSACYVRREKQDRMNAAGKFVPGVMNQLPAVQPVHVPADLDNPRNYELVEADLDAARLEYSRAMRALEAGVGRGYTAEQLKRLKAAAKAKENAVGVLSNKALMVCGQEKLKFAIEWVQDFLDSTDDGSGGGEKLIVFGIHQAVNEAIASHFNSPIIYGKSSESARQEAEDSFQSDPLCRLIVGHPDAMGMGIDLTAATHIAFVELPYRPMDIDQAVGRAYGRLNDVHGVSVYYLMAPDTIDDHVLHGVLEPKAEIQKVSVSGA